MVMQQAWWNVLLDLVLTGLLFGSTGLLIEVYFTGFWSALHRDRKATANTSLWLLPVYGCAGLLFGAIHRATPGIHWLLMGLVYTLLIYGQEFFWHWFLERFVKIRVWDYGHAKYTIAGRVQPKYFPWWFALACAFNPLHDFVSKIFVLVTKYG
jgi:uncharacterized membrane protein